MSKVLVSIHHAWLYLLDEVMRHGHQCSPRGNLITEMLHTSVTVMNARNNLLSHPVRDINFRFMVAEWLWIQSGREDVAWIQRFNKNIVKFSDDGVTFRGAYGPRFRSQIDRVVNLLRADPDTRQAVIRIFDDTDLIGKTKDVPCTISLQLLLRMGKLHGIMTMRSNDLWLGFPYDFFNFSQITNSISGELGVEVGSFTLQAGSSHIYATDYERVKEVLSASGIMFDVSPQLKRLAPPQICRLPSAAHSLLQDPALDENERAYVQALNCATKAQALEILRTL